MAVVLVGLVGWPMMYATISAEGSDSFDAISRSYSYVYQSPWHYIWYSLVAIGYGAVVVFFVGFMGSTIVYLGKWGVSQTPFIEKADRDPIVFVCVRADFVRLADAAPGRLDGERQIRSSRMAKSTTVMLDKYKDSFRRLELRGRPGW